MQLPRTPATDPAAMSGESGDPGIVALPLDDRPVADPDIGRFGPPKSRDDRNLVDAAAADATCRRLAGSHYENFDVVSILVPPKQRAHLARLYAFCRHTDDLGDEASGTAQDRLQALDSWAADLARCWQGDPQVAGGAGQPDHPYLVALSYSVRQLGLSREPFERLIEANRMDQRQSRYATYEDLLAYCRHSADPVGQMVLEVFGCANPHTIALSDKICTGLQLANFWQDVAVDRTKGRVYLPLADLARFEVSESALDGPVASKAFRHLLAFEVARARSLLVEGTALIKQVPGALRPALGGFVRGGLAILDRIEAQDFDVLSARPEVSKLRKVAIVASTIVAQAVGRW